MFFISKPRLLSIGLLLAILFISLAFSSYVEGLDANAIINKEAPTKDEQTKNEQTKNEETKDVGTKDVETKNEGTKNEGTKDEGTKDGQTKTKLLTVADITNTLQANSGVQKLLTSLPVKEASLNM